MLGIACVPAFIVMLQVYFCPESPGGFYGKVKLFKLFDPFAGFDRIPSKLRETFI